MEFPDNNVTWKCILTQYIRKIIEDSKKNPGISVFVMTKKGIFNCQYEYMVQGTPCWNEFMKMSKSRIEEVYSPDKMYLVSVFIPVKDQTVGNIRGFLYDTHQEVDFDIKSL